MRASVVEFFPRQWHFEFLTPNGVNECTELADGQCCSSLGFFDVDSHGLGAFPLHTHQQRQNQPKLIAKSSLPSARSTTSSARRTNALSLSGGGIHEAGTAVSTAVSVAAAPRLVALLPESGQEEWRGNLMLTLGMIRSRCKHENRSRQWLCCGTNVRLYGCSILACLRP